TARLMAFRARYPVDELAAERDPRIRQDLELEARVESARQEVDGKTALIADLRSRLAREPRFVTSQVARDNPRRLDLELRLRQLNTQRLELLEDFLPASPEIQTLDAQIAALGRGLAKEPAQTIETVQVPNPRLELQRTELD